MESKETITDKKNKIKHLQRLGLRFILEILSVIIGVFIAFVIDENQKEKENIQYVNQVIVSISKELKENENGLKNIIYAHQAIIDTVNIHIQNKDIDVSRILDKTNGVMVANIKSSSWKTFLYPNIKLVDYKIISVLSDIDEDKNVLKMQLQKLAGFLYSNDNSDTIEQKRIFKLILTDLLNTEKVLLAKHDEFLKEIDSNKL